MEVALVIIHSKQDVALKKASIFWGTPICGNTQMEFSIHGGTTKMYGLQMEPTIKMDDLEVPLFQDHPILCFSCFLKWYLVICFFFPHALVFVYNLRV